MRVMPRRGLALLLAASSAACSLHGTIVSAQLPTPQLTSIYPPGAKQGAAVDLAVAGADLDDGDRLLFSHPGIVATPKLSDPSEFVKGQKPVPGAFRVQVAPDVPAGIYEVRAISRFGVSNPRAFVIGSTDELLEAGGNNQADKAIELAIGAVVNGRADANARDYYKVTLAQGQRVLIECQARLIDSRMDAMLVLLDPNQREVARSRDFRSGDPMIDFTAPAAGVYTIVIYDFVFAGGADHFYRLSAHNRPYIDFVYPPSGLAGSTAPVTVYGRNLPGGQVDEQVKVAGRALEKVAAPVAFPGAPNTQRLSSNRTSDPRSVFLDEVDVSLAGNVPYSLHLAAAPVIVEAEPNSNAAQAQKITLPCEIVGQFYPARDVDYFQFDAKKGESYQIETLAHRMGLNSDPVMRVQRVTKNDKGEEVLADIATVDDPGDRNNRIGGDFDTSTDDPAYRFAVPEDGTYRLSIRDQFGDARNDPRYVYRASITPLRPDFRMVVVPQPTVSPPNPQALPLGASVVRRGGTASLQVQIERQHDLNGEIQLTVEGLPAGVQAPPVTVAAGATSATIIVVANDNVESWAGPVKVVGKAAVAGGEVVRQAKGGAVTWGTGNRQQQLPVFRTTSDIVFAVCGKDLDPALAVPAENKVWETSLGGTLTIPVNLTRRGEYKEAVKLVAAGLPGEIKPGELNLDPNTATANLSVPINNQATKPGLYTFVLRSDSKFKYVRNPDAIKSAEDDQQLVTQLQTQADAKAKETTAAKDAAVKAAEESAAGQKQAEQTNTTAATAAKQAAEVAKQAGDKLTAAKDAAAKDPNNQSLVDAAAAAQKAADEAAAAAKKAAEQAAAAEKALTEAVAKAKAAAEAKVQAEAAAKQAQDRLTLLNTKKQEVDKRVTDTKAANQPKDVTFAILSAPITIRVVPSPLVLTPAAPAVAVKQGAKVEVAYKLDRQFGFADQVEMSLEPPQGVAGIPAAKGMLPNGQADGKLELAVEKTAPEGEHKFTLRAKAKFNNVNVESTQTITVKVEKGE